jgi:hypothetical protein
MEKTNKKQRYKKRNVVWGPSKRRIKQRPHMSEAE